MRCFVAAWPDHATRLSLEGLLVTLHPQVQGGRPMQSRNLHLTLAFIVELPRTAAEQLAHEIDGLSIGPFAWSLNEMGWFPQARVAWVSGASNAALDESVSAVRSRLDQLGVMYDRKAFVAHVTLFRDVRAFACGGPLVPGLPWQTARVALFAADRDERGPVYLRVGTAC
jgi:RNA 2',3'-cyclic 3'-phosphodiesterase